MLIKTLLGTPVLGVQEGKLSGSVCGWLLDGPGKRVAALLYASGNWYDGVGAVYMDNVQGMGDGAVIVHSLEQVTAIDRDERLVALARERIDGMGAPAFSPTGKTLGKVADLDIGEKGEIRALLLEDGSSVSASRILLLNRVVLVRQEEPPAPAAAQAQPAAHRGMEGQIVVPSSVGNPIIIRTSEGGA